MQREARSFCRLCGGLCGMRITIDANEQIVRVVPDKDHPISRGYACSKGLAAAELHQGPTRLLHPLKRQPDGSFARIGLEQALDEIAAKLSEILDRDGPDALAGYRGTPNWFHAVATYMLPAWLQSLGAWKYFSTYTIDQSAKWVSAERLGTWGAGSLSMRSSDVWLLAGSNPLVSVGNAALLNNPPRALKAMKDRGLKLIVVDPRRSETALQADLHLQIRPGEDPTLAAGLLRLILEHGWDDPAFWREHAEGAQALRAAVVPFTPAYVAQRAGIAEALLLQAAELFAGQGRRGAASTGTGPNMSPRSNLSEHLYESLNVICGRYPRAGERVSNPGVLSPRRPYRAQAVSPGRSWEHGPRSRGRGMGMLFGELMTAALPDEILTPGEGQVRAIVVAGGNPAGTMPQTRQVVAALSALDLLVTIDPFMTSTARLSHYVLPPLLMYEIPAVPCLDMERHYYGEPYAQYTPAIVAPPPDSDIADDSYIFWSLSKRMARPITFRGAPLALDEPPTLDALLAILLQDAQVPFEELKKHPLGSRFDVAEQFVEPATPERGRFDLFPPDVRDELASVLAAPPVPTGEYPHLLVCRRMREVSNTMRDLPSVRRRRRYNPAYLHSRDLAAFGLAAGARIEITSAHGTIPAIVAIDDGLRQGVVSMSHGWGGLPGDDLPYDGEGSNTSMLLTLYESCETINGMPRMSAVPVRICAVSEKTSAERQS
jgi:anaerobic selenocysteine-containing dehydrogenase